MADVSPLAGLLDRAGRIFLLSREFARALAEHDDEGRLVRAINASSWERNRPAFDDLCAALEELGDEKPHPPLGSDLVAEMLRRVRGIALQMSEVAQNADGLKWQTLSELCIHLDVAVANGEDVLRRAGLPVPVNTAGAFPGRLVVTRSGDSVPNTEVSEPVTIDNLLDYAIRVRDSLDDAKDLTRDEALNLIQVAKAYKAASDLGVVRTSEIPEVLFDNNGAKRKLDTLIPLLRARLELPISPETVPASSQKEHLVKLKRSTQRGDGRAKLIAALTAHHNYASGGALNTEPINNNELARRANVSVSTASNFFKRRFKGYEHYRVMCRRSDLLVSALNMLNDAYSPHMLLDTVSDEENRAAPG